MESFSHRYEYLLLQYGVDPLTLQWEKGRNWTEGKTVFYLKCCRRKSSNLLSQIEFSWRRVEIKRFIKYSMIYYVIINETINSKLLFSLSNNFKSKFNVCHFKSTYLHSFQHGKTQNLLWPVNAIDQWNCLLHKGTTI